MSNTTKIEVSTMSTVKLQRNKPKGSKMRQAATKAKGLSSSLISGYPIQPPEILKGVVPEGTVAPILALDSSSSINYSMLAQAYPTGGGFPGFSYLSQLATRAEFRAFASALSTELTREWIEFTSKQDDDTDSADKIKAIEEEFKRLNVRNILQTAAENDCYFGRAQIFIDINGADRKTPLVLDPRTVKKGSLNRLASVEAVWTTPAGYNALDPAAPDFYKPSRWFMLGQEVHASRLMTVITRPLPDILKPAFDFAGMSLSQLAEPYVNNWLRTRQSVADLINNFSITALATSMDQVLQGDDDGTDLFARAELFTATRSNKGLMLLDKEREEIVQINTPLSGLHELQAQSQEHMCSVSRTPAIVLTGISPSGLNASSDGEIRIFYDWIAAQQEAYWRDPIEVILKCVQLSLFGEIDPDVSFSFIPLYQMTPKELAEIRQIDGVTATSYIDRGVLDPIEQRERLARNPDSGYHGLDIDSVNLERDDLEAFDKSVSEAQHKAMAAAASGHSNLGIPQSVGKEFISKDAKKA
jgi:phage-related protein (TIGR01555 family)